MSGTSYQVPALTHGYLVTDRMEYRPQRLQRVTLIQAGFAHHVGDPVVRLAHARAEQVGLGFHRHEITPFPRNDSMLPAGLAL